MPLMVSAGSGGIVIKGTVSILKKQSPGGVGGANDAVENRRLR